MQPSIFIGDWKNPKQNTQGIYRFTISEEGGQMHIAVEGAADGLMAGQWGKKPITLYGNTPVDTEPVAFETHYRLAGKDLWLAGNVNKGLIIIAIYARQIDTNSNKNFFIREFFFKKRV